MADDQRLQVQFSADIRDFEKAIAKLEGETNSALKAITRHVRESSKALDNVFNDLGRKASTSLAAIGAAVGTKELMGLSDTWTTLKNKVAAVSQSTGMQARSMSDLVKGADDARSSIESYTDLYAKLMRSSSGIAKNEEEVARATNIVSKAFVAGGAAASEQAAGVLQLGQALGSGFLQGDELRSIRENAPLLAEAIAKEFNTTIGGLKDLGSEGKLTSDRVFKAILEAGASIEAQFNATNATMADGFTRIKNALAEYVGIGGQASGVSQSITQGLIMIADNFDKVADAGMVVVGVIAGELVGRSLPALIKRLADAGAATKALFTTLNSATSLGGVLTAIGGAGPALGLAGAALGGAVLLALNTYMQKSAEAAERTKTLQQELTNMGLVSTDTAEKIENLAKKTGDIGSAENIRRIKMIKEELARITNGSFENKEDELPSLLRAAQNSVKGGDDGKALVAIKAYLELVEAFPSAAVRGEEAMQNLRDSLDLTEPMQKMTYQVQNAMQTISGLIVDAQIKGEDLISPAVQEQVDAFRTRLESTLNASDAFTDNTRQQLMKLWDEFTEGKISAEELKKKFEELGGTYALMQNKLLPTFQNLTAELGNVKDAADKVRESVEKLTEVKFAEIMTQSPSGSYFDQYDKDQTNLAEFKKTVNERANMTKKELDLQNQLKKEQSEFDTKYGPGSWDRVPYHEQVALAKRDLQGDENRKESTKKPKKPKEDDYDKLTKSMEEHRNALLDEASVQAKLNPLVNDYGYAAEKAKTQRELWNAAIKAGRENEDGIAEKIEEIAEWNARAEEFNNRQIEANDKLRSKVEAVKDAMMDVSRTFTDAMISGKKFSSVVGDALMRLGQRLVDAGLKAGIDSLFKTQTISQGGFLGKLFGFDTGGYTGDGGTHEPAGIVHGGEYVFSRKAVQNAGVANLEAMHNRLKGYANGGFVGGMPQMPQMPRIPSINDFRVLKSAKQQSETERAIRVSVTPSKYFDVHVEEISNSVTAKGIQQYDHVLDQTAALKVQNSRAMGRSY